MNAMSSAIAGKANRASAQSCGVSRIGVRFTDAVMQKAQDVFKTKIAAEMAARAKSGLRTAEYWKSGERTIDLDDFLQLLDCEEGAMFLDVFWDFVPAATRERWLRLQLLNRKIQEAENRRAADDLEVEQLRMQLTKKR